MTAFTERLVEFRNGAPEALDDLVPVVYKELRAIAHRQLRARDRRDTLETTALVNEAYLKLVDQSRARWEDRAHFFALAALAMRHVIVDRAKARRTKKRGGAPVQVTLEEERIPVDDQPEVVLQLNEALDQLALVQPRLARVVEYRFFGGLTEPEIATVLGVTERTVQRDWSKARMLLQRALAP